MTLIEDVRTRGSREDLQLEFQDEEYRYAYAEDFLNTWIATQVVTLREQRGLSQSAFGELIGTKQPGVSRLENVNHSKWKTETLKRIARALGVRLKITFETFGSLLDEDEKFNRGFLQRPKFNDDPAFRMAFRKPHCVQQLHMPTVRMPAPDSPRQEPTDALEEITKQRSNVFVIPPPCSPLNSGATRAALGQRQTQIAAGAS